MEMGQKIKQLRYKTGLTQEQLAEQMGVSAQSVSKWETGASMPDISLLPILAETFGVSIDELFDLTREQRFLNPLSNIRYCGSRVFNTLVGLWGEQPQRNLTLTLKITFENKPVNNIKPLPPSGAGVLRIG